VLPVSSKAEFHKKTTDQAVVIVNPAQKISIMIANAKKDKVFMKVSMLCLLSRLGLTACWFGGLL
jgi:hypothetical protein